MAELTLVLARAISLITKTPLIYEIVSYQLEAIHHDGELESLSFSDYVIDLMKEAYFIAGLEKHLTDRVQVFSFQPRERASLTTRLFRGDNILDVLNTLETCLVENSRWTMILKASKVKPEAHIENISNMRKIICMTLAISSKDISWMTPFHKEMYRVNISSS